MNRHNCHEINQESSGNSTPVKVSDVLELCRRIKQKIACSRPCRGTDFTTSNRWLTHKPPKAVKFISILISKRSGENWYAWLNCSCIRHWSVTEELHPSSPNTQISLSLSIYLSHFLCLIHRMSIKFTPKPSVGKIRWYFLIKLTSWIIHKLQNGVFSTAYVV